MKGSASEKMEVRAIEEEGGSQTRYCDEPRKMIARLYGCFFENRILDALCLRTDRACCSDGSFNPYDFINLKDSNGIPFVVDVVTGQKLAQTERSRWVSLDSPKLAFWIVFPIFVWFLLCVYNLQYVSRLLVIELSDAPSPPPPPLPPLPPPAFPYALSLL